MFTFLQLSSLEKIMPIGTCTAAEYNNASVLTGETFSYQIAYSAAERTEMRVTVESKLQVTLYDVECIPAALPAYPERNDAHYISTEPGLYPDLLVPKKNGEIVARPTPRALWVTVQSTTPGSRHIKLTFTDKDGSKVEKTMEIEVLQAALPPQKLLFTQWFHADCIASYYNAEVFSERHWQLIDAYMQMAAEHGMNMILTPVFTPPLDTEVGGERPAVQLVGIKKQGEAYTFDFELLRRWLALCEKNNISHIEIAHLFTQWGAAFTPKIIAEVNGEQKRIFGWDVKADSPEYKCFLDQFLPALTSFLHTHGMAEKTVFHISDEPHGEEMLTQYKKAKDMVKPYLHGFKIMDALSDIRFYKSGAVEHPIPANDAIEPFLQAEINDLWTYYCCGQSVGVSNRFFAMPSSRNRILGLQLYKYGITGFLHWGYNFYYSQHSKRLINPYITTDADGAFPSGDAFSVYPGIDGPHPSLRLKVFHEALQDLRALQYLEQFMEKKEIISMLEDLAGMELTFSNYPHSAAFILEAREKINDEIRKRG